MFVPVILYFFIFYIKCYIEDASRFTAGPHSSAMVIRIRGRSIAEFVFDGFGKLVFLDPCRAGGLSGGQEGNHQSNPKRKRPRTDISVTHLDRFEASGIVPMKYTYSYHQYSYSPHWMHSWCGSHDIYILHCKARAIIKKNCTHSQ